MDEKLKNAFDPSHFRRLGHQMTDLLADYLEQAFRGDPLPVYPEPEPIQMEKKLAGLLTQEIDFMALAEETILLSNHLHHPQYAGHQVSAPLPLAALCEMMGTLLNNASAIYEMGPVSVAMERIVMKEMAAVLGFPAEAEGFFTSGGTLGNLTALLAARQAKAPFDAWKKGLSGQVPLAFLVPEESHYSLARSLSIMGIGESGVVKIPSGNDFRTRTDMLYDLLKKATDEGKVPIGLAANACSTAVGIYDPLDSLAEFCQKHGLWFHVDAAHGAPAIFSEQRKQLLQGIEKADSVVIDFHKMMMAPALLTLVLFRNPDRSWETFSQHASYLFQEAQSREWFNPSKRTMECTKHMMGFTAYCLWKYHGPEVFGAFVESRTQLALDFAEEIKKQKDFSLAVEPQSNIVCFRYERKGWNEAETNGLNEWIRRQLLEEGQWYIVQAQFRGKSWLRVSLMNPATELDHLKKLLKKIREWGDSYNR